MATINMDNLPEPQEMLDQGFAKYDDYRVENLNNLVAVKQVQTNQLNREYNRLLRKYGEDHPLTIQTQTKIELNQIQEIELTKEIIRVETPAPTADEKKWKVYGYVLSPEGKPICGIDVFLFDENKRKIDGGASAETDEKGCFIIEVENIKELPVKVFAGVSTSQLSSQVLQPKAGHVEYVELIIGEIKPTPPDDLPTSEGWTVMGKILSAKGEGIPGLTVKVFDKDVFDDDFLGETKTNKQGIYKVNFPKEKFSDFFENYPEVYLLIENEKGEMIYNGRSKTNYGAGYIELMDVQLEDNGMSNNEKDKNHRE